MAIYEITHKDDKEYCRKERIFFGVGKCDTTEKNESQLKYNIKEKNYSYCELTGIYAIHKNMNDDYVCIEHYRRCFLDSTGKLLSERKIRKYLNNYKIILPFKYHFHRSMYEHYCSYHYQEDYSVLREIIRDNFPEYMDTFMTFFESSWTYPFNMICCFKDDYDRYCEWLFRVLELVEIRINDRNNERNTYQKRVYGFMAERLLTIWVMKNFKEKEILKLPVAFISNPKHKHKFSIRKLLNFLKNNL